MPLFRWKPGGLSPLAMSRVLLRALGYYGDSVAVGVATCRRSRGCEERFGLSGGPPFVPSHPDGVTVRSGSSPLSSNELATIGFRVSASFPRGRHGSGGLELKQCSLARGQPCWRTSRR